MKTSFLHTAIIIITSATLLSSCASLYKNEFAQRKYYDFPRSKHSISGKKTEYTAVNFQKKTAPANTIVQEEQISAPIASLSATQKEILLSGANAIIPDVKNNKMRNTIIQKNAPDEKPIVSYKKSDVLKLIRHTPHRLPFSDAGVTFFIMVIAAILIPPLGVYIKDRPRITTWFWVTLLLCILSVSILMWTPNMAGTGLWFIAALIALLVVFDII